jgi:outer membrane biosynthesis protein TonB
MSEFINSPNPFAYDQEWKLPLSLAIAVHLVVFGLLIMPPSFLMRHREFQEIQTINLFTPEELKPAKHQRKMRPKTAVKKIEPPKTAPQPKAQSINIDEQPQVLPKPDKIISLRPRKLKKRPPKPVKKEPTSEDLLRKALERTKARINAKKEKVQLRNALSDLVKNLHNIPTPVAKPAPIEKPATGQAPDTSTSPVTKTSSAPSGQTGQSNAAIGRAMRQYYMAISRRIHDNWSLPETQNWQPSLEAIIVIVVHRNGTVSKTFFEKKSSNVYFNQYVEKTISASSPMPAFPSDIKKERLEIGLKFRPSGMF